MWSDAAHQLVQGRHEGTNRLNLGLGPQPVRKALGNAGRCRQETKVVSEEVFGPVLSVIPVADVDAAFARVNASRHGLQVGVFTHDLDLAFRAHRELQVGGVIVGDVPSFRADQMPYGGVKDSGVGREGILAAMSDLRYERTLVERHRG